MDSEQSHHDVWCRGYDAGATVMAASVIFALGFATVVSTFIFKNATALAVGMFVCVLVAVIGNFALIEWSK